MSEGGVSVPTPPNEHGGKSAEDLAAGASVATAIRAAVHLLPAGKRRLLFLAAAIQVSLGLLDLLGIALVGLVAAVAVTGITAGSLPGPALRVLSLFGADDFTISQLSILIAGAAVTVLVAKTVASAVLSRRIMVFLANRQAELSVRLARDFLSRPLSFIQQWTTPEAMYALGAGASAATVSLLGSSITIAAESFLFVIVGVTLLVYDPALTLAAAAFFGVIVLLLQRLLGRWSARNAKVMTDAAVSSLQVVSEALSTYRESTVLNRRELYVDRFRGVAERSARTGALNAFLLEVPKYALEAALYLGIVVLAVVQFITKDWAAAASTTALFLAAGSRVIPALLRLQGASITVRNAAVQAQPTFFLAAALQAVPQVGDAPTIDIRRLHTDARDGHVGFEATVEVDAITARYADAEAPALRGVSFRAEAGTSVALVGSTGAGKSTLADIILGLLEPESGTVRIGGLSPREAVRRFPGAVAYVPQSVALTIGSVRENVALGIPSGDIDDDLVWEALQRAHLADYLTEHREGLGTFVGERGFRLSGGQRQRLGIARALYTRPRLLVLDEATSALDAETERAIIETLEELEGEVTTITVAHRLATVRRADLLLYLQEGIAVARGTFDEVREQAPGFDRQAALLGL